MPTATIDQPQNLKTQRTYAATSDLRKARELGQSIRQICHREGPLEEVGQPLVHLLASQQDIAAATLFAQNSDGEWRQAALLECMPELASAAQMWESHLLRAIQAGHVSSGVGFVRLQDANSEVEYVGVLARVPSADSQTAIVCLVGDQKSRPELLLTAQLVSAELAAGFPVSASARPDRGEEVPKDLLNVAANAAANGDVTRAFNDLASEVREQLNCDALLLGSSNQSGRRCRLQSIAGTSQFQRHTQLATCAEELLSEAMLRDAPDHHDETQPSRTATEAQRQLARLCQARFVTSGPICDQNGTAIGAWAILEAERPPEEDAPEQASRIQEAADSLSERLRPCFELLRQCRSTPLQRLTNSLFVAGSKERRRALLVAAAAIFGVMVLPLPFHVKCDCEVQAVTRRHVPVPYTGLLEEVFVEPGDVVQANQVLARMDGREIAWELAARQAEYERAKKQHDVQLAGQQTAAAQVAKLEMERLKLQIKLLDNRAENLEIRSPIDGVVIRGDPKTKENARLKMGETLFEVAPLEEMVVEVLVPGEDVAYVRADQQVKIRLDAFPGSPRYGTIRRISPEAVLRDHESVFLAEVGLDNRDGTLRPGMIGRSRVKTVVRPLAWNLFHRPWDRIIYLLAW